MYKDNLEDMELGLKSQAMNTDASSFEITFTSQRLAISGQLLLSVKREMSDTRDVQLDRLNSELTHMITTFVRDNMPKFVKEVERT